MIRPDRGTGRDAMPPHRFVTGYDAPSWLNALRTRANDLGRSADWPGLHAACDDLRRDGDLWPELWGPLCAVAARRVGDPTARALLDEVIAAGFHQPEMLDGELAAAFGADPDWPDLIARIQGNRPPPSLELLEWPTITPAAPLTPLRLPPDREPALRARLPRPSDTAWGTATALLAWVARRWRHAGAHMEVDDAVACLDRVDAGERFACVEYSLVLSQALNARGVPARRLELRRAGYHAGLGQGHMVSEAWIDELGRWVLLDGQNGLYWTDAAGTPLGVVELQNLPRSGTGAPVPVTDRDDLDAGFWRSYFHSAGTTGGTWTAGTFVPVFQRNRFLVTDRLERRPDALYPDLSELAIGTALVDGRPAVRPAAAHPFAEGFTVRFGGRDHPLPPDAPAWVLPDTPGKHLAEIAVRTRYATLVGRRLRWRVD